MSPFVCCLLAGTVHVRPVCGHKWSSLWPGRSSAAWIRLSPGAAAPWRERRCVQTQAKPSGVAVLSDAVSVPGFGSMLRALGAQIEKTTNREACRDLSGRRLRDVNHEKE